MRDGTKEVLAVTSGYRESTDSWAEVFRGLKARGLAAPKLLMADGNAAIWGAARTVWPEAGEQRCWNHKMRNVLDRLPQREQSEAKELLRTVVYASTRAAALKARQAFGKRYGPWYPKAVTVLEDDWDRMVTFYDFPAAHWKHLRTTNVVESRSLRYGSARRQSNDLSASTVLPPSSGSSSRWRRNASEGSTLHTCSRTCLKKGSSGTESPSQIISAKQPPETFTHLLTRPPQSWVGHSRHGPDQDRRHLWRRSRVRTPDYTVPGHAGGISLPSPDHCGNREPHRLSHRPRERCSSFPIRAVVPGRRVCWNDLAPRSVRCPVEGSAERSPPDALGGSLMSWIKDVVDPKARLWEEFYRNRAQYDRRVRRAPWAACSWDQVPDPNIRTGLVSGGHVRSKLVRSASQLSGSGKETWPLVLFRSRHP